MKNYRTRSIAAACIITALMTIIIYYCAFYQHIVIKAVIDVGSGSTKLMIAKINLSTKRIHEVLYKGSFYLAHQEDLLNSKNNSFSEQTILDGLEIFRKIEALNKQYKVQSALGVATAAFRTAHNGNEYLKRIYQATGLKIITIDQITEGKLAYLAAFSTLNLANDNFVIWDIGGGSLQMITKINHQFVTHLCTEAASIKFKNHVTTVIKRLTANTNSPNPLSKNEIEKSLKFARNLAKNVNLKIKNKLHAPNVTIISVGDLFFYNIASLTKDKQVSQDELRTAITASIDKMDHEINPGNNLKYANVAITNAILVLGFMEELNIQEINIVHINTADGLFFDQSLWT